MSVVIVNTGKFSAFFVAEKKIFHFPDEIWNCIKEYAGIYDIKIEWNNKMQKWILQSAICDSFVKTHDKNDRYIVTLSWNIAFTNNNPKLQNKNQPMTKELRFLKFEDLGFIKVNFWKVHRKNPIKKKVFEYISKIKHFQ